jgi:hypothetical protein
VTAIHPEAETTVAGKRRLVRALNAQIRLLAQSSGDASGDKTQVDFVCECPHESCFAVVPMTLAEWGAATSEADYYVAHPEHVDGDDEAVVASDRYAVARADWRGERTYVEARAGTLDRSEPHVTTERGEPCRCCSQ